jgi:ATP-binding cassette subfamily C protein
MAVEMPVALQARNQMLGVKLTPIPETLTLENVHYVYPGAADEALKGVSLTIRRGTTVGFIGASGAGKSTLIDIVLGLLTPIDGRVLVDGVDIHKDLPAWQREIGYVPQKFYLIDDSIRRNIAFGIDEDKIDDVAVARAVQAVQMESFVNTLPQGLETAVGHEGLRLSGGQRQRIAIARALYHDPSILVMDEATNALDVESESEVLAAVHALQGDKTVIIVAHRLSAVAGCDQLFRLEAGQLVCDYKMAAAGYPI